MGNTVKTCLQTRFVVAICVLGLVFFAFPERCTGQSTNTIVEAIELLENNEPAKAKAILVEEIASHPSAIAYANLATAELAMKQRGEAAYAFEMARALGGFSESEAFRQNLQQGLPAELRSLSDGPLRKIFQPILRVVPQNGFSVLALLAMILATFIGLAMMFREGFSNQSWTKGALFALVILAGLGVVLAKARSNYRNPETAVVMNSTQLYQAPSAQSERVRSLPEGAVVSVGELLNQTYRVTLPTGVDGWVPEGDLKLVNIP